MTQRVDIPEGQRRVVHVFALPLPNEQVPDFTEETLHDNQQMSWPMKAALGARELNADYIEVFPVEDLKSIGLSEYLVEGYEADEEVVYADKSRLDGLKGNVVLADAQAFGGVAQVLEVKEPLVYVGSYGDPVQIGPPIDLSTPSAQGEAVASSSDVVQEATKTERPLIRWAAILVVLALLIVVATMVLG